MEVATKMLEYRKLKWEWGTSVTNSSKPSDHKSDWFGVDTDPNTIYVGFNNGN